MKSWALLGLIQVLPVCFGSSLLGLGYKRKCECGKAHVIDSSGMYACILDSFSRFREKLSLRWTGRRRSGHRRDRSGDDPWSCTVCLSLQIGVGVYLSESYHRILRASEEGHTESYIICPSAIVGTAATGPVPAASFFFHFMSQVALGFKKAVYVGEGSNVFYTVRSPSRVSIHFCTVVGQC
jgi:hypothetical protein